MLGYNGSGKSTAVDVINLIRLGILGKFPLAHLFGQKGVTSWSKKEVIRLELDLHVDGADFKYWVEIVCPKSQVRGMIHAESLTVNGDKIFERDSESVSLGKIQSADESRFPLNRAHSVVAAVQITDSLSPLSKFRNAFYRILCVRPLAPNMDREAEQEDIFLDLGMDNFARWYRAMSSNQKFAGQLQSHLNSIWDDFGYLKLDLTGRDSRTLQLIFENTSPGVEAVKLDFDQLSDGERMLVGLYALSAYQQSEPPTTIILDEPDNYISLSEIQPWLLQLLDDRPENGQIIIVSHHPEIVELMGESRVSWFERTDHFSPTRVRKLEPNDSGLTLSERISRGWISA